MRYLPLSETDRSGMLARMGVTHVDELFADVPAHLLLKDPLDLPPMHQVMARRQPQVQPGALRSPLAVMPHPRQLRRRERTPEAQVGHPHRRQHRQRRRQVRRRVAERERPPVLVISDDRGFPLRHDHARAMPMHQLRVVEVRHHLHRRPLVRCFRPPQPRIVDGAQPRPEPLRQLGQHLERITLADQRDHRLAIHLRVADGRAGGIREGHSTTMASP